MTEESTPAEELTEVAEVVEELEAEVEVAAEAAAEEEIAAVVPEDNTSRGKKFKAASEAAVEVEAAELQEVVEVVVPAPAATPATVSPAATSGGMSLSIRNRR